MQKLDVFAYHWSSEDRFDETTSSSVHVINLYGLMPDNSSCYLQIEGFKPWVYLQLPDIPSGWNMPNANRVKGALEYFCKDKGIQIDHIDFVMKEKLYEANVTVKDDGAIEYKKFAFLQVFFKRNDMRKKLSYALARPLRVLNMGELQLKCHEQNATPILQYTSSRNLPTAGWITTPMARSVPEGARMSYCAHEFKANMNFLRASDSTALIHPLVLSMDIESNSSNPARMPDPTKPKDDVRMISCVFWRQGTQEYEKYLLSLGEPDPERVGDDVTISYFDMEADLLVGYTELVLQKNPQIIIGFNIFGFDFPFMIARATSTYCACIHEFDQQGVLEGRHGAVKTMKWSSSAFKTQEFTYLDCEGRLFIDLYPMVQREFKLDSYSLKNVSINFLGTETKDPLSPKGIFMCFRKNTPTALGIVGKYCVQDSLLVAKLFEKLNVWAWVSEKATVCNVPIFTLYTSGQQITVFSQVYKFCFNKNIVVEMNGYESADGETYTGAFVFPPVPGLYDNVTSFDFSSLYPTTIIAYNIDYHTIVYDPAIPDDMCHVIEWEDHIGCVHDKTVRKTKVKKVMCDLYGPKRYRFLKEPKGVLPTILVNLLDARKRVNKVIDELKVEKKACGDPRRVAELESEITVLDKRQLSLKVSANSMYGAMGVTRGFLPFMPGAMCTTARGRQSIEKAMNYIKDTYNGELVYGDTDSCYVHFTHTENPAELYDFCERVEEEMLALFPRPMKLAFEGKIYWRFFILTKKRYMALTCDRDGKVASKPFTRGVILSRRDNSACIRALYQDAIMKIFVGEPEQYVMNVIYDGLLRLFRCGYPLKDFVITKSVGDIDQYAVRELPKTWPERKAKLIKALETKVGDHECSACEKGLRDKCTCIHCDACSAEREYHINTLPAQVQLAERMRRRGKPVQAGSRLEFVVTMGEGIDRKLCDKMEDLEYFKEHAETLRLDPYYYLKFAVNPFDQMIEVAYKKPGVISQFFKFMKNRLKLLNNIRDLQRPELDFPAEEAPAAPEAEAGPSEPPKKGKRLLVKKYSLLYLPLNVFENMTSRRLTNLRTAFLTADGGSASSMAAWRSSSSVILGSAANFLSNSSLGMSSVSICMASSSFLKFSMNSTRTSTVIRLVAYRLACISPRRASSVYLLAISRQ